MKTLISLPILISLAAPASAIVIDSSATLSDVLESLGITNHPNISVSLATLKYGTGDSGAIADDTASLNSMDYMIAGNNDINLVGTATSGKKQGDPGFVPPESIGTFSNASGVYGFPGEGLILSSGNVNDYEDGPNTSSWKTTNWGNSATADQETLLEQVTGPGSKHYDVTELNIRFDVDATLDTLSFLTTFASEEFASYQGSAYNDGFGIFLNGQNIAASVAGGGEQALTLNITHPDMEDVAGTELDGVINSDNDPVLRFETDIAPGSTDNLLTLIIADRADQLFDTTAFIKLESVISGTPPDNKSVNPVQGITLGNEVLAAFCSTCLFAEASSGKKYKSEGANFTQIAMPSENMIVDDDGFELWIWNGVNFMFETILFANDVFDFLTFDPAGASQFEIRDIEFDRPVDINDPRAFVLGANFDTDVSAANITVSNVSEPRFLGILSFCLVMGWLVMTKRFARTS